MWNAAAARLLFRLRFDEGMVPHVPFITLLLRRFDTNTMFVCKWVAGRPFVQETRRTFQDAARGRTVFVRELPCEAITLRFTPNKVASK